jgi:hypothetical protein
MVARWFIFMPKVPIWVHYGGNWYAKCWYIWNILRPLGVFNGRLVQFVVIAYIFSVFGMCGPRKIWQPCSEGRSGSIKPSKSGFNRISCGRA